MTEQTKFLIAGIFFLLLLVTTLTLMKTGKTDSVSSSVSPVSSSVGEKMAGQLKNDSVRTLPQSRSDAPPRKSAQVETAVSQAQIDLVRKREEARNRRDEMMAVRAQTIKDLGPGNTGEPQR